MPGSADQRVTTPKKRAGSTMSMKRGLLLVMVALGGVIGAEADPRRMPTMANSMFSRTMLRRTASTGSAFDSMQGSGRASPPPVQRSDSRDWGSDAAEEGSGRGALIVAVRGGAEGSETQRGEESGGGSEENMHGEQQTSTTMWGNNGASTEQSLFGYGADEAKDENGFVTDYQGEGDVPDARSMGGWLYEGIRPSITQEESIMGGGTSASRSPRTQLDPDETLRLHNKLMSEARDRGVLPHFTKDGSNPQHEEYTTTPPQSNHIPSSAQWSSGEVSGSSAYTPGVVEATRGGGGEGKVEGPIKVNAIVCFKLMVPHAGPADEVVIVGNNAVIGSWLPDKGVRLEASLANDPGLYTLDLALPLDVSALEYKYVLRKAGGTAYRWEEKLSNRRLVVGESASGMYLEVLEGEFDVSTGKKNRMVLPVRELTEMELRGLDYDDDGGISGIASTTAGEYGGVEAGSSFDLASQAASGSGVGYSGGEVGGSSGKEDESYGSTVRGIPQDLKGAQGEIERLREALAVSNSKVEQLVGMTGTLDQARKLLESKSKDVDVLKQELAEYQRNLAADQAAAASQSSKASGGGGKAGGKELEEMKETLAKHQDMVKSLTSQLKEMGAKFQKAKDEYEAEIKKLTEALQSAKKDQASIGDALKAELEARKTALEHVDASMEALKIRMGEFKSAEEALKNDLAAAVKERDALSASISDKDKEVASLKSERDALSQSISGKDKEVASLKSERDALSQSISGKDKEVTGLVSSLAAERDALSASISEKDKEVASLRAEKEAISASISDKEREVASLKAEKDKEVASLRAEKDKEVASLKAERDALATEKRLAEGVMGSQLEAEATKKTLADNARNLVQMEQLQKETQEQLDYAITLNRELDEELDQLKKEVQRQSGETMELSNALSEQLEKFKAQEGVLAKASQAQKATEVEADELKAKILDLEKRIEETMGEKAKVEAAQEEALASLKNAEKGIKAAETDAANSRGEGEVLKGQVQSLELRVAATARDMALLRSQAETGGGAPTELISELKGIRELQLKSDHEARIASIQRDAVMRELKSYKEVSLSFEADLRGRLFAAERDVASLSSVSSRGPAACKSLVTMKDTLQQRVDKIKPFIDAFCGAATSGGEGVDKNACVQLTERAHSIGDATMQRGIKGLERVGKACEAVKGMCDVLGEAQEGVKSACSVQHGAEERMREHVRGLRSRVCALQDECDIIKGKREGVKKASELDAKQTRENVEAQVQELDLQIKVTKGEVQEAEAAVMKERESLGEAEGTSKAAKQALEVIEVEIGGLREAVEAAEGRTRDAEAKVAAMEADGGGLAAKKQIEEELTRKIQGLKANDEEAMERNERALGSLEAAMRQSLATAEDAEADAAKCKSEVAAFEAKALQDSAALESEYEKCRGELDTVNARIDELNGEQDEMKEKLASVTQRAKEGLLAKETIVKIAEEGKERAGHIRDTLQQAHQIKAKIDDRMRGAKQGLDELRKILDGRRRKAMDDMEAAQVREREAKLMLKRDQGAYENAREEAHHKEDQVRGEIQAAAALKAKVQDWINERLAHGHEVEQRMEAVENAKLALGEGEERAERAREELRTAERGVEAALNEVSKARGRLEERIKAVSKLKAEREKCISDGKVAEKGAMDRGEAEVVRLQEQETELVARQGACEKEGQEAEASIRAEIQSAEEQKATSLRKGEEHGAAMVAEAQAGEDAWKDSVSAMDKFDAEQTELWCQLAKMLGGRAAVTGQLANQADEAHQALKDQVQFMADAEKGLKRRVREMEAEIEKARKESLDGKNDAEKAKAESEQLSKSVLKLRSDLDSSKAELVSLQNVAKDRQAKDTALDFPKRLDHVKQALAEIRASQHAEGALLQNMQEIKRTLSRSASGMKRDLERAGSKAGTALNGKTAPK